MIKIKKLQVGGLKESAEALGSFNELHLPVIISIHGNKIHLELLKKLILTIHVGKIIYDLKFNSYNPPVPLNNCFCHTGFLRDTIIIL